MERLLKEEIVKPLFTEVRKKTSIIKISGMNLRDLSNIKKKKEQSDQSSQVIIKRSKTNMRINPILELRVEGA
jgi:hypothetical protein